MNKTLIAAVIGLALAPTAQAQVNTNASSGSVSQSNSGSVSYSQGGGGGSAGAYGGSAGAYSGISVGVPSGGGSTRSSGSGGVGIGADVKTDFNYAPNETYNTSTNYDLSDAVPSVIVPGVGGGGSNPCVTSMTIGGSGSGFGIGLGRSWNDPECQIREHLRIMGGQLNPQNEDASAIQKNIACQSPILAKAFDQAALETGNPRLRCSSAVDARKRQVGFRLPRVAAPRAVSSPTQTATAAPSGRVGDTPFLPGF